MASMSERSDGTFYTDYEIRYEQHKFLHYAGYYFVEDALTGKEVDYLCEALSKQYDEKLYKGAVIGHEAESAEYCKLRNSSIQFVKQVDMENDKEYQRIHQKILTLTEEVNKNIFNYDIPVYMPPQYTNYGPDQYFEWHPDGPQAVLDARGLNLIPPDLMWRKLSLSIMLSDKKDYKGGQFDIMVPSRHPKECIDTLELDKGTILFFPAYQTHRVRKIEEGKRKALVYWFCGPRWR